LFNISYQWRNFCRSVSRSSILSAPDRRIYQLFSTVKLNGGMLRYVMHLVSLGKVKPVIDCVYTTWGVRDALTHMQSCTSSVASCGKVVVMMKKQRGGNRENDDEKMGEED
jgi:hypothetical protein